MLRSRDGCRCGHRDRNELASSQQTCHPERNELASVVERSRVQYRRPRSLDYTRKLVPLGMDWGCGSSFHPGWIGIVAARCARDDGRVWQLVPPKMKDHSDSRLEEVARQVLEA